MNATTILCILLLSLYLVLAVFWIVRSIIDTIDERLNVKSVTPSGRPSVSRLSVNAPFVKSNITKPE